MSKSIDYLQRPEFIWRPNGFDRVTVKGSTDAGDLVYFSILGVCFSEYKSGPNLRHLANVATDIFGAGMYGLESCNFVGWRHESPHYY